MASQIVNARIDTQLKKDVDGILANIGLTGPEAIRLFYTQIRNKRAIPFSLVATEEPTESVKQAIQRSEEYVSGKKEGFHSFSSVEDAINALSKDSE